MNFSAKSAESNWWRLLTGKALLLSPHVIRQIMRISLCTVILLTTSIHLLSAFAVKGQSASSVSVTIGFKNESLESAIKKIESITQFRFVYRSEDVKTVPNITLSAEKRTLDQTLDLMLKNTPYSYKQLNNSIMVVKKPESVQLPDVSAIAVAAVRHVLKVYITDVDGELLAFANVTLKGSAWMTAQANQDGYVYIPSITDKDVLIVSFVGYATQEVVVGTQETIHVKLVRDPASTLKEVAIVSNGYQTIPQERSTGAFSVVTAKDLEKIPLPNLIQRLEGMVPGLQVSVGAGDRTFDYANTQIALNGGTRTVGTNDYNVTIRGNSTVSGEKFPLIVIDGAVSNLDLSTINPNDVDNVTFLKDAAAASIWGIRAANGVIVINTKRGVNSSVPKVNFSTSFTFSEKPDLGYLKTMTSAQDLAYEKELVDRGFVIDYGNSSYSNASANVRPQGSLLALQLKAGTITQAQYNAQVSQLSSIDNRSQISQHLLQPAQSQQYTMSVSGGNDFSNYYYSASYSHELPNTIGNSADRLTLNLTHNWKLFKIADLSVNVKGASFKYVNNGISFSSLYTASQGTLMPYNLLKDASGNNIAYDFAVPSAYAATLSSARPNWQYSYLNELNNNNNAQKDNNYTATINLRIPLYKGLTASGLYSTERTFSTTRLYYSPDSYYYRNFINYYTAPTASINSIGITNGGILNLINTTNNNYTVRGQLDYNNTFAKIHQVTALAGTEIRETQQGQGLETLYGYNTSSGLSTGVNAGNTSSTNVGYATVAGYNYNLSSPTSQGDKTRRYLSYYGNAAYTLNSRYVLTGSVRYDDYNNFGLDRQYRATPAWSAGLKWNASDESFIKQFSWISNLGIRATYGINGNISTTVYPFTYITISTDALTQQPSSSIIYIANPQLKWEKTYVTNLGVDFAFLNSRISGSVDYYRKRGTDILASFPINTTYTGNINSGTITQNSSKLNGKGVDMGLNGIAVNSKNVRWSLGGSFSYNTNEVIDDRYTTQYTSSTYATTSYYAYPTNIAYLSGYATDKILVFRNAGLDANGLTQVYDENGNIVKATTAAIPTLGALKYAGRRTAPYYGSWNTSVRYKDFTLFAVATYQFGSVFLKPSINTYSTLTYQTKYDLSADIANRWQKPGDELTTSVPGLNGTSTAVAASLYRYQYSDINVLKGDYIRLREVSLSYQLPMALVNKVAIKGASLGFAVRNLGLLWTANKQGYDPDFINTINTTYSLPAARSYILSLNVNL